MADDRDYVKTNDVATHAELCDILGTDNIGDIVQTCAGEWRKEYTGDRPQWRFWECPDMDD